MSENVIILFSIIAFGLLYLGIYLYDRESIKVESRTYEWKNFKVRPYFSYYERRKLYRVLYTDRKGVFQDRVCYVTRDGVKWRDDLS
jgi:hypothetical protein